MFGLEKSKFVLVVMIFGAGETSLTGLTGLGFCGDWLKRFGAVILTTTGFWGCDGLKRFSEVCLGYPGGC